MLSWVDPRAMLGGKNHLTSAGNWTRTSDLAGKHFKQSNAYKNMLPLCVLSVSDLVTGTVTTAVACACVLCFDLRDLVDVFAG